MASFIFNKDQSKTHQALLNICENDNDLQYLNIFTEEKKKFT